MNDLTKYREVADQIKTGDLLQWHTHGIFGTLIRWKTQSKVNHSGLAICLKEYEGLDRRRFTTEALNAGTVLNLLSRRLEQHQGEVWWYPLIDEWNDRRQAIGERALQMIGIPYDFKSIAFQLFGHVSTNDKALFCSEYCAMAYGILGTAPTPAEMFNLGIFKKGVQIL